jgi:hypothetical protein
MRSCSKGSNSDVALIRAPTCLSELALARTETASVRETSPTARLHNGAMCECGECGECCCRDPLINNTLASSNLDTYVHAREKADGTDATSCMRSSRPFLRTFEVNAVVEVSFNRVSSMGVIETQQPPDEFSAIS